jgi:hypothetical protein
MPAPPITVTPADDGTIRLWDYGVLPTNPAAVNRQNLQNVILSMPPRRRLRVYGTCNLDQAPELAWSFHPEQTKGWTQPFAVEGVGPNGHGFAGNFAGPLLKRSASDPANPSNTATGSVTLRDLELNNFHRDGGGFYGDRLQDCGFYHVSSQFGAFGIRIGSAVSGSSVLPNQDLAFEDCNFSGQLTRSGGNQDGIGLDVLSAGSFHARNCRGYNCGTVFNFVRGSGILDAGHCEVNQRVVKVGDGANWAGEIRLSDCEGTGQALVVVGKGGNGVRIYIANAVCTGNIITPQPQCGIDVQTGSGQVELVSTRLGGSFAVAALRLAGNGPVLATGSTMQSVSKTGAPVGPNTLLVAPMTLAQLNARCCVGIP